MIQAKRAGNDVLRRHPRHRAAGIGAGEHVVHGQHLAALLAGEDHLRGAAGQHIQVVQGGEAEAVAPVAVEVVEAAHLAVPVGAGKKLGIATWVTPPSGAIGIGRGASMPKARIVPEESTAMPHLDPTSSDSYGPAASTP